MLGILCAFNYYFFVTLILGWAKMCVLNFSNFRTDDLNFTTQTVMCHKNQGMSLKTNILAVFYKPHFFFFGMYILASKVLILLPNKIVMIKI